MGGKASALRVPWSPGQLVLRRQFHRGDQVSRVWVGHVVADDERGLWAWFATGSAYLDIGAADGRTFREVPFAEWGRTPKQMRRLTWYTDVLMLHPPGAAHSVWFTFHPDDTLRQWYVNLEDPGTRWYEHGLAGIDTVDHDLDVVVEPDRSWRWKDEAEFVDHLAHPDVYWVADAPAVWAEGKRVVTLIEAGRFPFDGAGVHLRPDPAWEVPTAMPNGWDRPRAQSGG